MFFYFQNKFSFDIFSPESRDSIDIDFEFDVTILKKITRATRWRTMIDSVDASPSVDECSKNRTVAMRNSITRTWNNPAPCALVSCSPLNSPLSNQFADISRVHFDSFPFATCLPSPINRSRCFRHLFAFSDGECQSVRLWKQTRPIKHDDGRIS